MLSISRCLILSIRRVDWTLTELSYLASVDKAMPCQTPKSDAFDVLARPLASESGVAPGNGKSRCWKRRGHKLNLCGRACGRMACRRPQISQNAYLMRICHSCVPGAVKQPAA